MNMYKKIKIFKVSDTGLAHVGVMSLLDDLIRKGYITVYEDKTIIAPTKSIAGLSLRPLAAIWIRKYGGIFPYSRAGRIVKQLASMGYDIESITNAWERYVNETESQFVSLEAFGAKFGQYHKGSQQKESKRFSEIS